MYYYSDADQNYNYDDDDGDDDNKYILSHSYIVQYYVYIGMLQLLGIMEIVYLNFSFKLFLFLMTSVSKIYKNYQT